VALIGYGVAGATFHAPVIAATPGLRFLGRYYAHAGGFIRTAQSDVDLPGQTELFADHLPQLWPYAHDVNAAQ
jgi:hypothetical protein